MLNRHKKIFLAILQLSCIFVLFLDEFDGRRLSSTILVSTSPLVIHQCPLPARPLNQCPLPSSSSAALKCGSITTAGKSSGYICAATVLLLVHNSYTAADFSFSAFAVFSLQQRIQRIQRWACVGVKVITPQYFQYCMHSPDAELQYIHVCTSICSINM